MSFYKLKLRGKVGYTVQGRTIYVCICAEEKLSLKMNQNLNQPKLIVKVKRSRLFVLQKYL